MAEEMNSRRAFMKRAGLAATVLAGSVAAVAATSESQSRGSTDSVGNGVVTGRSKKKEILYKKTQHWNEFYGAAK